MNHKRIEGVAINKFGRTLIKHNCPSCGKEKIVLKWIKEHHPLCQKCASIEREKRYKELHGHGQNYRGSKYFSAQTINHWKKCAKDRNLEWSLSFDDLDALWEKQEGKCIFTGTVMCTKSGAINKGSLDRIDSNKGYMKDNVQFTCSDINFAKKNKTDEDFIKMCLAVVNHRINNSKDNLK